EAGVLLDDRGEALRSFDACIRVDALPAEEEAKVIARTHRLDLRAKPVERIAMDASEQPAITPFELGPSGREVTAQDPSLVLDREQRWLGRLRRVAQLPVAGPAGDRSDRRRPVNVETATQ